MEKQLIDPRATRWGAAITSLIALATFSALVYEQIILGLSLAALSSFLFIWSVFFKRVLHPYSLLFSKLVKPNLKPSVELEGSKGIDFAQKIGLIISLLSFAFAFISPWTAAIFSALLFIASSLNAYLNICLGCILYLRFRKLGIKL